MKQVIFLFVLAVLLTACAETKVVQIDNNQAAESTETQTQETTGTQASTGAAVNTGGKVPTACDDMDADAPSDLGVVEVTYSDGTTEKFYDFCPGKDLGNDMIVAEYVCDGNEPKTKNYVCTKSACMMFAVKADPGKQVGACV